MSSTRLLVVSHTPHHRRGSQIVGWGATVRELDYLAKAFGELVHLAPLHSGEPPASFLPYTSGRVRLVAVPPAGGTNLRTKLTLVDAMPRYAWVVWHEMRRADFVHVRCPCNIGIVACLLLALDRTCPRWIKFGGNWQPTGREPLTSTLQRWWLSRGLSGGVVTVNGRWSDQPKHIYSFLNPCLTEAEVSQARQISKDKHLSRRVRLLFAGTLVAAKGAPLALDIMTQLLAKDIDCRLDYAGDGPLRGSLEDGARVRGLTGRVHFHGWLPRSDLNDLYARAHIMLFPSKSEGWPKVLSEAMAYGAVPVASAVSSIPQVLNETGAGRAVPPHDRDNFVETILKLVNVPAQWSAASQASQAAASLFTYERYLCKLNEMLRMAYGRSYINLSGFESDEEPN